MWQRNMFHISLTFYSSHLIAINIHKMCFLTRVTDRDYFQTHRYHCSRNIGVYMHVKHAQLTVSDGNIGSVLTNPHSEPV